MFRRLRSRDTGATKRNTGEGSFDMSDQKMDKAIRRVLQMANNELNTWYEIARRDDDEAVKSQADKVAKALEMVEPVLLAAPKLLAECERMMDELASAIRDGVSHFDRPMLERWYKGVSDAISDAKAA